MVNLMCIVFLFGDGIGFEVIIVVELVLKMLIYGYDLLLEYDVLFWLVIDWYWCYGVMMLEDVLLWLCEYQVLLLGVLGDSGLFSDL